MKAEKWYEVRPVDTVCCVGPEIARTLKEARRAAAFKRRHSPVRILKHTQEVVETWQKREADGKS